jgi:uncharacterized membrane protein
MERSRVVSDGRNNEKLHTFLQVGWEIWFGAFAGAFPFAIGLYEFIKRIVKTFSNLISFPVP